MKSNKIIYWIATIIVLLFVGLGSIADLLQIDAIKQSITAIGFPLYVIPFFGVLKLLGSLTIVIPALKRLKEGAYAGLFFYFIGATYCHIVVGDSIDKYAIVLIILSAVIVSYIYAQKIERITAKK
ncbi:DoxX family protein [Aquimarina rhabdastrellae]